MKKILCCLMLIVLVVLSGCRNYYNTKFQPCYQPGTEWISDNKTITFKVLDEIDGYGAIGKLIHKEEEIEFFLTCGVNNTIIVYKTDVLNDKTAENSDIFEEWVCTYKNANEFVAVVEKTTFFEIGEQIEFKKMVDKAN